MAVKITDFEVVDIKPKVSRPEFEKLLPKNIVPQAVSFVIAPVSNAVSNAIRRTISCEYPTRNMYCEYYDVYSTDLFIIPEMVAKRIRSIPIRQDIPKNSTFEIKVENKTAELRDVKSSEITILSGPKKMPFNETFTLFTLNPGKYAHISNIRLHEALGYNSGDGMHAIACQCSSTAIGAKPYNAFDLSEGTDHSRNTDCKKWKISFVSHGLLPAEEIIANACGLIIERLEETMKLLYTISSNGTEYILVIPGESDTIGNLLMKTTTEIYPDIPAITYSVDETERICTVRIRSNESAEDVLTNVIKSLIKLFGEIKKQFV